MFLVPQSLDPDSPAAGERLRTAVYDALMASVLDALRNLDLSYQLPGPGEAAAEAARVEGGDPAADLDLYGGLLAASPSDMLSFYNLTGAARGT